MKLKMIIALILLFSLESLTAKGSRGGIRAPYPEANPAQARVDATPFIRPRKLIIKPESYAQALESIRTKKSSDEIVKNNIITQNFIDFVTSLNLSKIETKALLEAGAHIHMQLSNNDETNNEIILSLKNSIQEIINRKPKTPVKQQVQPIAQKKLVQPTRKANLPEALKIGTTRITFVLGDIVNQKIDAIVNAANEKLLHGSGVAGAISQAAGPGLQKHSDDMPIISKDEKCPIGEAVITPPFNLRNNIKKIIHTVGPRGNTPNKEKLLYDAYQNSLKIAEKNDLRSVAFPAISTALFGYNINEATPIAFNAVRDFIESNPNSFDEIRFVLLSDKDMAVYKQWANTLIE